MNPKQIVKSFFESDFYRDGAILDTYLHNDFQLFWNSSAGYSQMDKTSFKQMLLEMSQSFESLRCVITHLLQEDQTVTIRYTIHIKTIENPDEEMPMAHFIGIFELKDEQLLKGFQISQPADESIENLRSFLPNNS